MWSTGAGSVPRYRNGERGAEVLVIREDEATDAYANRKRFNWRPEAIEYPTSRVSNRSKLVWSLRGILQAVVDYLAKGRRDPTQCVQGGIGISAILESRERPLIDACAARQFGQRQLLSFAFLLQ